MCSGGGFKDFGRDMLSMASMGLIDSTAERETKEAAKQQKKAQNAAAAEAARIASEEKAQADAAAAAQEEIDRSRKARITDSYLTSGTAAGEDPAAVTRKSYLGSAG